ncbi:DUF7314 family protein [Salinarchaeum laminariae]|uniref:DUF7314 family protein n=1 Tax=Salinarchaeum laminariae TaxID=869888 RepID=UPI0020BF8049|nr:hypothetical protein [Salinarchaeum laminariae]
MADEFVKGFGILSGAGLIWMILAGWYRTPSFGGKQLTAEVSPASNIYEQMAYLIMDAMFWFMILGPLTFWVLIPLGRQLYAGYQARGQ